MATPINAPLTSEIWHLSIDDLLEPICESPRLGGVGPFVINLSASSAPLGQPAKTFVPPGGAYVYQIQRMEDRRPRYRLRLGPFATEDEADAMLGVVRDVYPSALTATAESDDLRAIGALQPKPPIRAQPAQPAVARSQFPPAAVSIPVLSDSVEWVRRPLPAAAASSPGASPPAVSRGPVAPLGAVNPSPKQAPSAIKPIAPVVSNVSAPAHRAVVRDARPPSLESTQTLRPLTTSELQATVARWYVIQLSLSSESFDPDSLPNLDIFNEYRLYSVAGLDQGRIVHALRLGFFADEGAAGAVASYLGEFYEKPTVKRISVAERERFRDQRVEARKDIGATGRHAVIEITGERHIREKRPGIATVTPLAPAAALSQSTATPARKGR
jgi:hypothetical protein